MKLVSQSSLSRITPNRSPSASNKINRARRACAASRDCPRTHRSNSCRSASFNLIMSIKHLDAFHTLRFTSIKIIEERQPITVRGVCYCLFVLRLIDSMAKKSTQRISRIMTGAREDGLIPWEWIVDDSRQMEGWAQYSGLQEFGEHISGLYTRDFWADQKHYPILISEK